MHGSTEIWKQGKKKIKNGGNNNSSHTKSKLLKFPIIAVLFLLLFTACVSDEPVQTRNITLDFNLGWWSEPRAQALFQNPDTTRYGGANIIPETVFAIGHSDDFIIAKQHPNKWMEIHTRLFNYDREQGDYLLDTPSDTIWLSENDSFYELSGQWYHISNGWDPPDSLFPYKKVTYYYIIDIRGYDLKRWRSEDHVYLLETEAEFLAKRKELTVPDGLAFTKIFREFE